MTVDLMQFSTKSPAGAEVARTVRHRMSLECRDPEFPIFLLSSTPEGFKVDEAYNLSISPVAKNLDSAALVAQQITFRLKEYGRFGRAGKVVVFARHASKSLAGKDLEFAAREQLRSIIAAAGFEAVEVSPAHFSMSILDELRRQIQEAGHIIVVLTRDEMVGTARQNPSHTARPNVYLELGMVLGVRGGNRKLILIQEEGAYLPSDVGSHQPFVFGKELAELREELTTALKRRS